MLARKDINAIWFELRKELEFVESVETTDWDDDLGVVVDGYDIYEYCGNITFKEVDIYFDLKAKYREALDRFENIEITEWSVTDNEDYFNGWDDLNQKREWYQLELAFESAERNKYKK